MSSIVPEYEYDVFISYRQNDNKRDKWVTQFVEALQDELDATFKERVSIYFDENPHDGLLATHEVDDSLVRKLKCLIFIPILSQTYCDIRSFAWQKEFIAFKNMALSDRYGLKVSLPNGNVASRILPVRIHTLDEEDVELFETEIVGAMRSIDFIYNEPGVNRPLRLHEEHPENNLNKTLFRNQINKVANSVKEVLWGINNMETRTVEVSNDAGDDQQLSKKEDLGSTLRRRNILRVCISYLLSAVLIWKVAEIVLELVNLPYESMRLVTLFLIILFPVAITFAWLYEFSPEGVIRTSSKKAQRNPFDKAQKKPLTSNTFLLAMLATVVALYIFFPHTSGENDRATYEAGQKSIAVLPFVNMSNDPEQEYFSDGISEELINALAKFPELKVSGRTSSFSFKDKNENMSAIGRQLGVTSILEGSVRRSGNRLRITAQLINAKDGFHIWTETYDRELQDIFAVQDEITSSIVNALKIHLIDNKEPHKFQSINTDAYALYLKARQKLAKRGLGNLIESRDLFYEVLALDSTYAPAYSGLGRVLSLLVIYSFGNRFMNDSYELAKEAAHKALIFEPDNAEAYSVLGATKTFYDWDWDGAEKDFLKSLELSPNDAEIYNFIGDFYACIYHPQLAVEMESKALELDPLHAVNYYDLAIAYTQFMDHKNAVKYCRSALAMDESLVVIVAPAIVKSYAQLGALDEIENLLDKLDKYSASNSDKLKFDAMRAIAHNDYEKALSSVQELEAYAERGEFSAALLAEYYIDLKLYDEAAKWLETAYKNRDGYIVFQSQIALPERIPDHPALQKALDKPEWNKLYAIRRNNLNNKSSF